VVAGDRVLVKNQSTSSGNGIYVVASGTWSRAADANTAAELSGATVAVDDGVTNGGKKFTTTFDSADSLGSTAMPWIELGGSTFTQITTPLVDSAASIELKTNAITDHVRFTIGTTEEARINGTGLGINTGVPLTTLDANGPALVRGRFYFAQGAETTKSAAATLTGTELLTSIIRYTGSSATLTMPTITSINSAIPFTLPTDHAFEFIVINTGSGTVTMAASSGMTAVGGLTVPTGTSACFRLRKTGTTTYTMYRV